MSWRASSLLLAPAFGMGKEGFALGLLNPFGALPQAFNNRGGKPTSQEPLPEEQQRLQRPKSPLPSP